MIFAIILGVFVAQILIVKYFKNFDIIKTDTVFSEKNFSNNYNLLYKLMNLQYGIYKGNLKEKNREMFFATLVHDLKTPTNAQIHSIQLLLDGKFGKLGDAQAQILKETLNSEKYMSNIISDILISCKYDYNKVKLKKAVFDVVELTGDVCSILAESALERNLTIDIQKSDELINIFADKLQIQRVITNLISNAIKYSKENSVIKISLTLADGKFSFSVINKSEYISKDKISKIFDKFSGYKDSGLNSASTGLGLYLSKKIIEFHGGKIYAESFTEGTCIFGFSLKSISASEKCISKV